MRCGISFREREWMADIFNNLPQLTFWLRQWLTHPCAKRTHTCPNSHSVMASVSSRGYHHYDVTPSALLLGADLGGGIETWIKAASCTTN